MLIEKTDNCDKIVNKCLVQLYARIKAGPKFLGDEAGKVVSNLIRHTSPEQAIKQLLSYVDNKSMEIVSSVFSNVFLVIEKCESENVKCIAECLPLLYKGLTTSKSVAAKDYCKKSFLAIQSSNSDQVESLYSKYFLPHQIAEIKSVLKRDQSSTTATAIGSKPSFKSFTRPIVHAKTTMTAAGSITVVHAEPQVEIVI